LQGLRLFQDDTSLKETPYFKRGTPITTRRLRP